MEIALISVGRGDRRGGSDADVVTTLGVEVVAHTMLVPKFSQR